MYKKNHTGITHHFLNWNLPLSGDPVFGGARGPHMCKLPRVKIYDEINWSAPDVSVSSGLVPTIEASPYGLENVLSS